MTKVPPAPRPGRSYDSDRREVLAELGRLDREKPPPRPGSVQSTDGSTIRIPGPLDDTGRDGMVLTYDEDLHQPTWQPSTGGGITGVTRLTAGSIVQANGASPVGSSVTFADYTVAALFGDAVSVTEDITGKITLGTAGFYMACAYPRLAWSLADVVDEVQVSADFDGAGGEYPLWYQRLGSADSLGGAPSLRGVYPWGPFYVEAGGWTSFGVNWMTDENCFLSSMVLDVWRVG